MQITLEQAEIETAIKQYIDSQINIKPDQEVSVNLAATRSPSGFTATIVIEAAGTKAAAAPQKGLGIENTVRRARASKTADQPPTEPAAETQQANEEAQQADPAVVGESEKAEPNVATAEAVADGVQEQEENEGQDQGAEEAPPPQKNTLFGGLGRPRNG